MNDKKKLAETLSDRIVLALNQLNVSQTELARRIGVSQQAIQHLCKNKLNYSKFTFEIATTLNINIAWLATGDGPMMLNDDPSHALFVSQKKIPLLSEQQILVLCHNNTLHDIENIKIDKWILSDACNAEKCFALRLKDNSMFPRFDQNTLIIVNPSIEPTNLNFVVTYIKNADAIVFRQLVTDTIKKILHPINSTIYKSIELKDNDKILGTVCEIRWNINS